MGQKGHNEDDAKNIKIKQKLLKKKIIREQAGKKDE
jgi:hypothetical protein